MNNGSKNKHPKRVLGTRIGAHFPTPGGSTVIVIGIAKRRMENTSVKKVSQMLFVLTEWCLCLRVHFVTGA